MILSAGILAEQNRQKNNIEKLEEVEFQVFSQRGEDGIIQYIISKIDIPNKIFIEFGIETYTESNTRLLLVKNNWQGLVMDGDESNIRFIKKDVIYWKYDLTAVRTFITKENINNHILNYTGIRDIGLLSIDVDGNDYWIWDTIDVIDPRIVICEYNAAFGDTFQVSVPYRADFERKAAHFSELYFGASLPALCRLASIKGYDFIGTGGGGVNAFFVRKDLSAPFKIFSAAEGFVASPNRDSKDKKGKLTFLPFSERLQVIRNLPVTQLNNGTNKTIGELYGL